MRLATILLLLATPCLATQDQWPALFDVTGVEPGDVLNIRAEPSGSAPIIGTLAHDAEDVEIIRPNDRHSWGMINLGEGAGWISLAFVTRGPGQWLGATPVVRSCFGTEPFWSLEIDDAEMTLTRPDAAPREGLISGRYTSRSRRDTHAFRGSFFPDEDGEIALVATMRLASCNDGMSNREYGVAIDVLLSPSSFPDNAERFGLYSGCCSLSD